jgi:hypothetical protein
MFDGYRMDFFILVDNSQLRNFHNFSIEYSGQFAKAITGSGSYIREPSELLFNFILIDCSQLRRRIRLAEPTL